MNNDAAIMLARTRAAGRGASPAEIQRNVQDLESDNPADCIGIRWNMFSVGHCTKCGEAHSLVHALCWDCRK
jgi:hypothetical protein